MWHAEQISRKLGQLPGAIHRFGIHQKRRQDFGIALLAGVNIEHEVGQRPLQPRPRIPVNRKPRAGKLRGPLQIQNPELFAQLPMRLGSEVELRRRSPATHFYIVGRRLAHRHRGVRHIRNSHQNFIQPRVILFGRRSQLLNLLPHVLGFGDQLADVLARFLHPRNLVRQPVAVRF